MKKYLQNIKIIGLLIITGLFLGGCGDDDIMPPSQVVPNLSYDSSKHIYGTFGMTYEKMWEIIIDPAAGQYSKILGTQEDFTSLSTRNGALEFTAFERNERIYVSVSDVSELKIQDLETFDVTTINLIDTLLDKKVIDPQILRFVPNQNEIYLLDTDKSIWKIALETKNVNKIHNGIPVSLDTYISNLFYIESTGNFLGMTNKDAINDYTGVNLFLFNPASPDSTAIISTKAISRGFGFIQHPVEKNMIYYIQAPEDTKGFRLMKLEMNSMSISEISTTDLAIDQLSLYLQTIHTASNSYILRGGSNNIEAPTNTIYSIDLNNGGLMHEFEFEETGFIMKLTGE